MFVRAIRSELCLFEVICGIHYFDSVVPLPFFYLAVLPIQSIFYLK